VLEGVPEGLVRVFAARVEVGAYGALDDGCVLGDDGEVGAEVVEAEAGGVDFVDGDVAGGGLDEAESVDVLVMQFVLMKFADTDSARVSVLLPAPVLPTMPTRSPALMSKLIFLSVKGKPSRYRTL